MCEQLGRHGPRRPTRLRSVHPPAGAERDAIGAGANSTRSISFGATLRRPLGEDDNLLCSSGPLP